MEEFKAMLKSAKGKSNMEILPTVKRRMESPSSNLVEIENPYAEIMRGTVAVRSDIKKFEIPVGGSVRFSFASFAKIFRDKISSVPLKIILEQQSPDKKSTGFDKSYRAFAAGEIGNIKVDGDLSEWAAVPSVKLENMSVPPNCGAIRFILQKPIFPPNTKSPGINNPCALRLS